VEYSAAEKMPALSVVVIGRNEGDRLVACLESVRQLRGVEGGIELIYVDSASTDGSPARAAALGATVVPVTSARQTAALARNSGWAVATAAHVLFLDGDTIVHPDFARIALDAIAADPTVAAVWGHRRELHPERSLFNRILDLNWMIPPGFTPYCGGDVVMRREILASVQGYDASLIAGEEPELCRRIRAQGFRILHVDAPMTKHDFNMTRIRQYWRRAVRSGHAYAEVSKRFRATDDPLWQGARVRNLQRGAFWTLTPLLALSTSIALCSPFPALAWLALLALMAARSGWKARWKSSDPSTLFLYGLHSHLEQVPILLGQLQFDLDAWRGTRRGLIEYKGKEDRAK
jgi:glycosyltransferase involved in cell wall biosynthesis